MKSDYEKVFKMVEPLVKGIADWEREYGTVAGIMPSEYADFFRGLKDSNALVNSSCRGALGYISDR